MSVSPAHTTIASSLLGDEAHTRTYTHKHLIPQPENLANEDVMLIKQGEQSHYHTDTYIHNSVYPYAGYKKTHRSVIFITFYFD